MTQDTKQMPERTWLWRYTDTDSLGEWYTEDVGLGGDETPYVRADLFDAQTAHIAALEERLRKADDAITALGRCVAEDCAARAAL